MLIQTKTSRLRPTKSMLRAKKIWASRQIQNILRIMQECAYPDQNVFIKTHKGYVQEKKKIKSRPKPSRPWANKSESGETEPILA